MKQNLIALFRSKEHVINRQVAEYLTGREKNSFDEVFRLLREQSQDSYLFRNIDFNKYYALIMQDVENENYTQEQELRYNSVGEILALYSDRMNIEELRKEFENNYKNNKKN